MSKVVDTAPTNPYVREFADTKAGLPGAKLDWLAKIREESLQRFHASGFPTSKVEAWKFTSLNPLAKTAFHGAATPAARAVTKAEIEPYRLSPECHLVVFVNGRFAPELSALDNLPEGTRFVDLAAADEDDLRALSAPPSVTAQPRARALFDLNTAFMNDGAVIHLGRGAVLDPVQLLFVATADADGQVFHPRNLICAEAGSSATVIETYVGLGDARSWTNAVSQVSVGENAVLRHYKLQSESDAAFHVAESSVHVAHQAAYRMFAVQLGGELARNEYDVDLGATDTEAHLAGVTLGRGSQHLDTTIRVEHAKPRGASAQDFKSVLDDTAHSVFQGRIRVAPGAQKTDAQQSNRNLLLSETAAADTKPELEILADDVKCAHGATVGDLEEDALFYLRARGIGEAEARAILVHAFVGELIDGIEGDAAREYFRRAVVGWLARVKAS